VTRRERFTDSIRVEPHFVLVDAGPDDLALRAVNLAGRTFDSAYLRPLSPRAPGAPLRRESAMLARLPASREASQLARPARGRFGLP
jgi:hypothetical protein